METDFLIIGSGPAGVSAAWPLVKAGRHVLMVDAGGMHLPAAPRVHSTLEWAEKEDRWKDILGADLGGLKTDSRYSPKFATPLGRAVMKAGQNMAPPIEADNALVSRAAATGGLSTIWGGFCTAFDEGDMRGMPITPQDLRDGYQTVAERIGIAGAPDDLSDFHGDYYDLLAPVPLSQPPATLLQRYNKHRDADLRLGYARNSVLTKAKENRNACVQCGLCLYGCAHKSIYSSADDLDGLRAYPNFTYMPKTTIRKILSHENGPHRVEAQIANQTFVMTSQTLLLGAGTVNTTALLLEMLGLYDAQVRMLCNPVAGMAFLMPEYIGLPFPEKSFGLGRLSYRLGLAEKDDYAMGVLYGADTLPLNLFASRMPFSRPASLRLSAALAPAMLMATCYLSSQASAMSVSLKQGSPDPVLGIKGETLPETAAQLQYAGKKLAHAMSRYRAFRVPGSFTISPPGSDAHLAGTVPMGGKTPLACNSMCEMVSAPGIYIIDGAWLPHLPPKHCTFTIMANATRVAKALCKS